MNFHELHEKINRGDYKSKLPYPQYLPKDAPAAMVGGRLRGIQDYQDDERRLNTEFEQDLYSSIRMEIPKIKQPALDAIYAYAWQEGHSNGHSEVAIVAQNILDLVEKCIGE